MIAEIFLVHFGDFLIWFGLLKLVVDKLNGYEFPLFGRIWDTLMKLCTLKFVLSREGILIIFEDFFSELHPVELVVVTFELHQGISLVQMKVKRGLNGMLELSRLTFYPVSSSIKIAYSYSKRARLLWYGLNAYSTWVLRSELKSPDIDKAPPTVFELFALTAFGCSD